MDEPNFKVSGHPTYLEWYKCYRDPTQRELIDGMELKDNSSWDAQQIARWRFFYRLDPDHLGDPQRREILNLREGINNAGFEFELFKRKAEDNCKRHSESTEIEIRNLNQKTFNTIATCIFVMLILFRFAENYAILPVLYIIIHLAYTYRKKKEAVNGMKKREVEKDREIAENKEKTLERIAAFHRKISELKNEILILRNKIPPNPDFVQMEADLIDEIDQLERHCLGEIVNTPTDPDSVNQQIRSDVMKKKKMSDKLIQGWGLLQQPTIQGPFGIEKTGLERVQQELKAKIATWRQGSRRQPIFRVLYLQYIFLLKKSISMYGFFYDIVTRKRYGIRSETFHYNHVANFSIKAAELEVPDWLNELNLPEKFIQNLFGKEVNVFSLTVSSGTHFRCTLIDEAVINAINGWLRENEKPGSNEPLQPIQSDNNYTHITNEILKQVREGVEQYAYCISPRKNNVQE